MTKRTIFAALGGMLLILHAPLAAAQNPYVNSTSGEACNPGPTGERFIDGCAQAFIDSVVTRCRYDENWQWSCVFHFDLYLVVDGAANCGFAKIERVTDEIRACSAAIVPGANEVSVDVPLSELSDAGGSKEYKGVVCAASGDTMIFPVCDDWTHIVTYPGVADCENTNPAMGVSLSPLGGGTVRVAGEAVHVPGAGSVLPLSSTSTTHPGHTKVQAYLDGPAPC